jgi:hypothetical protein
MQYCELGCPKEWLCTYAPTHELEENKNKKPVAVLGIFGREKFFSPIWKKYYGDLFGVENLHIIGSLVTDEYLNILDGANFHELGSDTHGDNAYIIVRVMQLQYELLKSYQTVVFADSDEFIVPDPAKYTNLKDFLEKNNDMYFRVQGYNVINFVGNEPQIDMNKPIIGQRNYWYKNGSVIGGGESKMLIVRKADVSYIAGMHWSYPAVIEHPDLYNIHLREFDYEITADRLVDRYDTSLPLHHTLNDGRIGWKEHIENTFINSNIELIPEKFLKSAAF